MGPADVAYGTLEIPSVMEAVTGRRFGPTRATVSGFARVLVRGEPYPGLVTDPAASTSGVLYGSIDARSLELLDRFEGDLYERRLLHVRRAEGGHLSAYAYVVPAHHRHALGSEPWDRARFVSEHLAGYLAHCRAFRTQELMRLRVKGAR